MNYQERLRYEGVVVGASAGGMEALKVLLQGLPSGFPIPVIIVQHRDRQEKELLEKLLQGYCKIRIKQADEKESIQPGVVYIAPPNYHLLVERDYTFSLSIDELCTYHYSRPSIDVLFDTAAKTYREKLIGVLLTGANCDGARGVEEIAMTGGLTIVQDPDTADYPTMPQGAIQTGKVKYVLTLDEIAGFLVRRLYENHN